MSTETTQGAEGGNTPALSPAEQASVAVGQRGFSEPTNDFTPAPSGPQRPDYIPEKFWKDGKADLEGLAKSYAELERGRSAPAADPAAAPAAAPAAPAAAPAAAPTNADGTIAPAPAAPEAPAADSPLAAAIATAATEYATAQEFTPETSKALADAGIPVEIQGIYLQGLKAQADAALTAIHGYVGGEQTYGEMANWARQNLSDAELDAYNDAIGNPQLRENAVRGLHARFAQVRPSEGNLVAPSGGNATAGDVYTDRAQLIADQRNPLYQTDAAFRQKVMDKLVRSQATGFQLVKRPMFERQIISS